MKDQGRIWDRFAKKYVASPIDDVPSYEHKLALTRNYMRPDMDVLEFGCGSGNTARLLAPSVHHYTAMDISKEMIAHGSALGPIPDNMDYRVSDFATTDLGGKTYDMILAMSVLHVLRDPSAVVQKVARTLKPGGYFVSSSVPIKEFGALRFAAPLLGKLGFIPSLTAMTADELRALMTDDGLDLVEDWRAKPRSALFLIARKPG